MSENKRLRFAIVKFPLEEGCPRVLVPLKWVGEKEVSCFYPLNENYEKVVKWTKKEVDVEDSWPSCVCVVMRKYYTYEDARAELRSEITSNLQSEAEQSNKKRKKHLSKRLQNPGEQESSECSDDERDSDQPNSPTRSSLVSTLNTLDKKPPPVQNVPKKIKTVDVSLNTPNTQTHSNPITPASILPPSPTLQIQESPLASKVNSTIPNEKIYERILQIQTTLTDIMATLTSIETRLINLERNGVGVTQTSNERDSINIEQLGQFPLKVLEDFNTLEEKLSTSPALQKQFVKILMAVGGMNTKSLTTNILRRLLSDELATNFSYTGKKGFKDEVTIGFGKTEICKQIHVAVKKSHEDATDSVIKKQVMGFLNQAKTRLTRREQENVKNTSVVSTTM